MIKFCNDIPIYLQIMDLILKDIVSGKYFPGSQIPSVRELSKLYSANPNTCQKAVCELVDKGLLVSCSTNGKFVTKDEKLILKFKNDILDELFTKFWYEVKALGFTKEEIIKLMKEKEGEKNVTYRIE